MLLLGLYFFLILILSIYSYALVDPNITFFNHPLWTSFRNVMVDFGYNQRQNSWWVYLSIIILLFIFNYIFVTKYKKLTFSPFKIAFIIGLILVFSYPFLSHDFFSYLFYTRILTLYHHNPYTYLAGDFYLDPWLRFTQWTGNNYPYGPVFLLISAIPSFLGFAKFAPTFFLFKIVIVAFYLIAIKLLEKLNRKWAIMFATNPLILVEGLINGHNDLIGISLSIVGIYFLLKKRKALSTAYFILSIGVKYLTLPFLFFLTKFKNYKLLTSLLIIAGLVFLTTRTEIQPWYFIMLFGLIPFYEDLIFRFNIFFFGLLMSYYPYVRFGGWARVLYWTTSYKVMFKHNVIIVFFIINLVYLVIYLLSKKKFFIK